MKDGFKNKNHKKVVIMGGGPAGLTAAYQLCKENIESVVFEKGGMVGGISKTVNYKKYYFDLGGHRFFTKIKVVEDMWKEVLCDDFLRCTRLSRIYFNKKFFNYPLKPFNALFGLGVGNSCLILLSYFYAHIFPSKEEKTFDQWVSNRFGKRLYQTFFKTYTEKVWGIPCSEIMAEWAAQRIKGLSLIRVVKSALIGNQSNITTLIDAFDYPKLGPGMMWQAVADAAHSKSSDVQLNAEVNKILWKKNKIESLEIKLNGKNISAKGTHFISSLPIRELIQKFSPSVPQEVLKAANSLKYRDFLTVALIIDKRDVFPDNWIYIHDPSVKLGRIQNFKNWSPFMIPDSDKTCLGLEYFCFEGDDLWEMSEQELIELGKKELEILGLVKGADVKDGKVVRVPKAYPVYDAQYSDALQIVRQFFETIDNLQVIGRNGMHRYNNMDHSMLTAMFAVKNIMGEKRNLWEINEEQEYHEEKVVEPDQAQISDREIIPVFSRIDKLGLATALGSVCGLAIFIMTLWLTIKGGEAAGHNLQLLGQYFIGYAVTLKGAFIGFGYGFFWGFLFGWLFAYLRNFFIALFIYQLKKKAEMLTFMDFLEHH